MCHINYVKCFPCFCNVFYHQPDYCTDFQKANPNPQPWIPTLTILLSESIHGELNQTKDGIHFLTVSRNAINELPSLKCQKKTCVQEGVEVDCPFHEILKEEERVEREALEEERAEREALEEGNEDKRKEKREKSWRQRVLGKSGKMLKQALFGNEERVYPPGHMLAGMVDTRQWYADWPAKKL